MNMLIVVPAIAVVCTGLLAGIYLGHRAGAHYALQRISASSFVQFQQVVHIHFAKFMPPLVLTGLASTIIWLVLVRSLWATTEFWLVAASLCGIIAIAAMTRIVNIPLNNELMTWNVGSPPGNFREIWMPWDRVNTIRTVVATGVVILQSITLSLTAAA